MGGPRVDEDWKCCMCPKYKAHKHEELSCFTIYGNNPHRKQDALEGNQYCEEHFEQKEKEFDEMME